MELLFHLSYASHVPESLKLGLWQRLGQHVSDLVIRRDLDHLEFPIQLIFSNVKVQNIYVFYARMVLMIFDDADCTLAVTVDWDLPDVHL